MTAEELSTCLALAPALTWEHRSTVIRCGTTWLTVRDVEDPGRPMRFSGQAELAALATAARRCLDAAGAGHEYCERIRSGALLSLDIEQGYAVLEPGAGAGGLSILLSQLDEIAIWFTWLAGPQPSDPKETMGRANVIGAGRELPTLWVYDDDHQNYHAIHPQRPEQLAAAMLASLAGEEWAKTELEPGEILSIGRRSDGAYRLRYTRDSHDISCSLTATELVLLAVRLSLPRRV